MVGQTGDPSPVKRQMHEYQRLEILAGTADRSGLEPGNVITKVDRKPVTNPRDFRQALKQADAKKGILLVITRKTGSRFEVLKESGD